MIASILKLSRKDCHEMKITDAYSIHRVVYSLFDDIRTDDEKKASHSSGILYVDKGGDFFTRQILILSNRPPNLPLHGEVSSKLIPDGYLEHVHYGFEIAVNPTRRESASRKLVAVRGRKDIEDWFVERAEHSWGFDVDEHRLQIQQMGVQQFVRNNKKLTHGYAIVKGVLRVRDKKIFTQSFEQGVGRGRAFGFGLLQIAPLK